MEIAIPVVPAGVMLLLNFFAPYFTSIAISPRWPVKYKKIVAVLMAFVLAALVLVIAYVGFGIAIPEWPVLLLMGVAVSQASYDLVIKKSADKVTEAIGVGTNG